LLATMLVVSGSRSRRCRVTDIETGVTPSAPSDPSEVIRMYTAMRSGNIGLVARILDARPDLVDVRENWTRADIFAQRLPWTRGGGTPLLRAVERGDVAMVRLLLSRGADPNGACSCDGGESPLWVAVLQGEREIAACLLASGAAPRSRPSPAPPPWTLPVCEGSTILPLFCRTPGPPVPRPRSFAAARVLRPMPPGSRP